MVEGKFLCLQIISERSAARWMSQFTKRLCFNLSDAFTRYTEMLTHFLQGMFLPILEAEAHFEYLALTVTEYRQRAAHLFFKQLSRRSIYGAKYLVIFNKVSEQA